MGGQIPYIVHGTTRGVGDYNVSSIWDCGLCAGCLAGDKAAVYFSSGEWIGLSPDDDSGELFEAAWNCGYAIVWPYFGDDHYDMAVIVDVNLVLDKGIKLYHTASAVVINDGSSIPPDCILFVIDLNTFVF